MDPPGQKYSIQIHFNQILSGDIEVYDCEARPPKNFKAALMQYRKQSFNQAFHIVKQFASEIKGDSSATLCLLNAARDVRGAGMSEAHRRQLKQATTSRAAGM